MQAGTCEALREGVRLFNAGAPWEAHERWEAAWREETGELRQLLHGLILAAAACVQRGRGREAGARTLFVRARARLEGLPATCAGLDVGALVSALGRWAEGALLPEPHLTYLEG